MIIPMLCVTIFVILVVWFLLPRVARLMIHTPTAISIFVCLSMVDRKSGSAGMPRPISYAVFCLKKKKNQLGKYLQYYVLLQQSLYAETYVAHGGMTDVGLQPLYPV